MDKSAQRRERQTFANKQMLVEASAYISSCCGENLTSCATVVANHKILCDFSFTHTKPTVGAKKSTAPWQKINFVLQG